MKLSILFVIVLAFFGSNLMAQNINTNPFWEGEIRLNDGTVKKGFVQVPNNPKLRAVSLRQTKDGKNERVRRRDIESIVVFSEAGNRYVFETAVIQWSEKINITYGKSLMLVLGKNNYATFYIEHGVYRVNSSGEIIMVYRVNAGRDFASTNYYIKKRDYKNAIMLYTTNLAGGIRGRAKDLLTEDPVLLNRINERELRSRDILQIIQIYLDSTKDL